MRELLRAFEGVEAVGPDLLRVALPTPTLPPATTTNHYLVGGPQALIVDPSAPSRADQRRLCALVRALEQDAGWRFVALFATHHHLDHLGAAGALGAALGLPLWGHAQTAALAPAGLRFDRLVEDGAHVAGPRAPGRWRALHTPGHAAGHLVLTSDQGGVIAGDMVAGEGTILVDPDGGSMSQYLRSLERLRALSPTFLAPAHGPVLHHPDEVLRHYRAHRLMREARVFEALDASWQPADALLPRAYADVARAQWPFALRSLRAHLLHLQEQGRAQRRGDGWRRTTAD